MHGVVPNLGIQNSPGDKEEKTIMRSKEKKGQLLIGNE